MPLGSTLHLPVSIATAGGGVPPGSALHLPVPAGAAGGGVPPGSALHVPSSPCWCSWWWWSAPWFSFARTLHSLLVQLVVVECPLVQLCMYLTLPAGAAGGGVHPGSALHVPYTPCWCSWWWSAPWFSFARTFQSLLVQLVVVECPPVQLCTYLPVPAGAAGGGVPPGSALHVPSSPCWCSWWWWSAPWFSFARTFQSLLVQLVVVECPLVQLCTYLTLPAGAAGGGGVPPGSALHVPSSPCWCSWWWWSAPWVSFTCTFQSLLVQLVVVECPLVQLCTYLPVPAGAAGGGGVPPGSALHVPSSPCWCSWWWWSAPWFSFARTLHSLLVQLVVVECPLVQLCTYLTLPAGAAGGGGVPSFHLPINNRMFPSVSTSGPASSTCTL